MMKKAPIHSPIEEDLQVILAKIDSQVWTINELFEVLRGKGYPFLILLVALPFCQPIQVPGFSTPFGIILIFIGLRMVFGRRIWWPQSILKKEISSQVLKAIIGKSLCFFKFLRPLLHPRMSWLCENGFYFVHGVFVSIMGVYLALPLPIPFTNLLAAWALFFLALGIIEEDGLFVCIGYALGLIALFLLVFVIDWFRSLLTF